MACLPKKKLRAYVAQWRTLAIRRARNRVDLRDRATATRPRPAMRVQQLLAVRQWICLNLRQTNPQPVMKNAQFLGSVIPGQAEIR